MHCGIGDARNVYVRENHAPLDLTYRGGQVPGKANGVPANLVTPRPEYAEKRTKGSEKCQAWDCTPPSTVTVTNQPKSEPNDQRMKKPTRFSCQFQVMDTQSPSECRELPMRDIDISRGQLVPKQEPSTNQYSENGHIGRGLKRSACEMSETPPSPSPSPPSTPSTSSLSNRSSPDILIDSKGCYTHKKFRRERKSEKVSWTVGHLLHAAIKEIMRMQAVKNAAACKAMETENTAKGTRSMEQTPKPSNNEDEVSATAVLGPVAPPSGHPSHSILHTLLHTRENLLASKVSNQTLPASRQVRPGECAKEHQSAEHQSAMDAMQRFDLTSSHHPQTSTQPPRQRDGRMPHPQPQSHVALSVGATVNYERTAAKLQTAVSAYHTGGWFAANEHLKKRAEGLRHGPDQPRPVPRHHQVTTPRQAMPALLPIAPHKNRLGKFIFGNQKVA